MRIWRCNATSETHGATLSVFSGCLLLCFLGTTGSGLDASANGDAAPHVLTRKEAATSKQGETQNVNRNVDHTEVELSSKATVQVKTKTNTTAPLLKGYTVIAPDVECAVEYYVRTPGTTPELCAQECLREPGCSIFSFRGGHQGCRISICGNTHARTRTEPGCGTSDGTVLSVKSGCGTGSSPGSMLYAVTASSRLIQRAELGHAKPIAPYQMLQSNLECGKRYTTAVAGSAGECAVACSKAAGCWAFSFREGDRDCRLSACLDSKAKKAEGECGTSPGLGRIGLSTQCAVEDSTNASVYLILQMNVVAKDAGCKGQYKQMDAVSSVYECRRFCVAYAGCTTFSYGPINGCRISTCFDASVKGKCYWQQVNAKRVAGFANNENINMTLAEAKSRCQHLGPHSCGAITCYPDDTTCTVRQTRTVQSGVAAETTYVPDASCYQAVIKGQDRQCGSSDATVFASEGQCYLGASAGDYVYNIPTKSVNEPGAKKVKQKAAESQRRVH